MGLLLPRLMSKTIKDEMVLLANAINPVNVFIADPDMEADYKKHLEDAGKENTSEIAYIRNFLKQFKEGDKLYEEAQLLKNYVNLYENVCEDINFLSSAEEGEFKQYHQRLQDLGPKIETLLGRGENAPGLAAILDKFNLKSNFDYIKNSSLKSLSAISENIENIAMSFEKMAMLNRPNEMNARRKDADYVDKSIEENKKEIDKVRQYVVKYDLFDPKDREIKKQEAGLKVSEIQKDIDEVDEKLKANSRKRVPMRIKLDGLESDAKEIEAEIELNTKRKNEIQALIDTDSNKLVELSNSEKADKESREYAQKIASLNKKQIEKEYMDTLNKKASLDTIKLIEGVKELDGKAKVFSDFSKKLGSGLLTSDRISQLANSKFVSSMSKNDPLFVFYDKFTKAYEEFHPAEDTRGVLGSLFRSKPQPGVDKLKEIISESAKNGGGVYILSRLKEECSDISQSYIKAKDNIKGYKEREALQAKLDQLKPQLVTKVINDNEVARENYDIDTEEYKKINNNISHNKRLLDICNASINEKNQKLGKINSERYPLYDEHEQLNAEYDDLNEERKDLQKEQSGYKKVIKFCDNLDEMKKKCDVKRDAVGRKIDKFKEIYGPLNANDARCMRIQKKLDSFIARINIDKGIRGNTDEYELMVTRLREARNVFEEPNLSVNKIQSALTTASSAAENYLNLKKQQKMVLGTDRRHSRIRFANEIKSFTSKMAENLNTNLPSENISEKERKILNYNKENLAKFEDVKSAKQEIKAADKSYLYTL